MEPRPRRGVRIFGGLILICLLLGLPSAATADSVSLTWDPNLEPDLAGYQVHIGTSPGTYTQTIDAGNVTTYTPSGLSEGETYYFSVTAYDIFANKSGYSSEVSTTIPVAEPPPPEEQSAPEPTEADVPSSVESEGPVESAAPPSGGC